MKATIKLYRSGVHKGHIIILTDDQGEVVERIAVTEVAIQSDPWPIIELSSGNKAMVS